MRIVQEYPLQLRERQLILMPIGAKVLGIQAKGFGLALCALVDTGELCEDRLFAVYPTGQPLLPPHGQCVGTALLNEVCWHCFEVPAG